jgi:lipopolysaccharide/colanic/teichoic acid biosynthesis glycosyltransferase
MTGLWQVEARDNVSFYAYRHLDLFYVENWSCALDVVVLANTVPVIITRALRSVLGRGTVLAEGTS